ncbi:hypothetical protein ACA097_25315 [Pseudomonas sp. QL9]|uniref:Hypothetical membrane protein n=1 Tax=Pseudomonas knackmussii (strain DSM 6978 / CCUG 54928 / LMG 23759 / B13) TaxID=1301098 RepID=A0A024HIU4_PSEKB|nr:hypothetical protein [Pseudomonas knackmussii]CDF84427.1 hypothetical membrane protein [Pseudomonas knackmussii B13]
MDSFDIGLTIVVAIVVLGTLINFFDRGYRPADVREPTDSASSHKTMRTKRR